MRNLRDFRSLSLLALLILIFFSCTTKNAKNEQVRPLPNILFIPVDDLRPELGCYGQGYMHTPNIDKLASEGRAFRNHFVHCAACGPSRSTLLSGKRTLNWDVFREIRESGSKPSAFIPEAVDLSKRIAEKIKGIPYANFTDSLFGAPTTAHILGGAVMAEDKSKGVLDKDNLVFGYENMLVCDGSAISANPGVNPALTITAMSELALSKIPKKVNI